tara:strand:- start:53 stop:505 length:453 start_codon:yes stop_codon:yes gene_type:complete
MAEKRIDREVETRATSERPKQWAPAELLPEPDKQAGYAYRWIRVASLNSADPRNLSAKLREGWEPVLMEEQPALRLLADPNSRYKDNIEIGGLLLCKTPTEFVEQRNKYYSDQADAQMKAVENTLMRQNDPRMPLFNEGKVTTGSFGKGG